MMVAETLARQLMSAANLPLHHPAVLQTNLLANRRSAAVASIQSLLSLLEPPADPSADGNSRQAAYVPPVRTSGEAAGLLVRRPSQNGAQTLPSPAAAFSDGSSLDVHAASPTQPEATKHLMKAADLLDPDLLSWAEEMASDPGNLAASRLSAWNEVTTDSSSGVSHHDSASGAATHGQDDAEKHQTSVSAETAGFASDTLGKGRSAGSTKSKQSASASKPAADPGAFNPGAFSMFAAGSGNEEDDDDDDSAQAQPAAADGAFDLSAFGFGAPSQPKKESKASKQPTQAAADPGAFDPGAFGFGAPDHDDDDDDDDGDQKKPSAGVTKPAADPGAFDAGAFGFGFSSGQEQDEEDLAPAPKPQPAADPGAFDPAAFGFGLPNGQKDADEAKPVSKAKPAADPGAFNPSAFGFGHLENGNEPPTSRLPEPSGVSEVFPIFKCTQRQCLS